MRSGVLNDESRCHHRRRAGPGYLDIRFRRLDVTNDSDWEVFSAHVESEHGHLDVLINNAGITRVGGVAEENHEWFSRVMSINATGQFLGMHHLWSLLSASGAGAIVNIASIFGSVSAPGFVAYSASKAAVIGMTKSAAIEGAKVGIRVNTVSPGVVYTPMLEEEGKALEASGRTFTAGGTPLDRGAQPEEISALVYFLASDEAGFITGSDFTIDGGFTAK
jgi:3alpha(or 20beta)-hydroxysteroid dehydrogenase